MVLETEKVAAETDPISELKKQNQTSEANMTANTTDSAKTGEIDFSGSPNNLFVGNLNFKVTSDDLKKEFSQYGEVVNVKVVKKGHRHAGFGFVEMSSLEEAERAVKETHQKELMERPMNVEIAKPRDPNAPKRERKTSGSKENGRFRRGRKGSNQKRDDTPKVESPTSLFIANLPYSTTNESLAELFKDFNITGAHIVETRTGSSKGFGFAEFATTEDRTRAIEKLNKTELEGRELSMKPAFELPEKTEEEKGAEAAAEH
eukprot:Nk52_evm6s759 gene=Nk52_evmTU6s759